MTAIAGPRPGRRPATRSSTSTCPARSWTCGSCSSKDRRPPGRLVNPWTSPPTPGSTASRGPTGSSQPTRCRRPPRLHPRRLRARDGVVPRPAGRPDGRHLHGPVPGHRSRSGRAARGLPAHARRCRALLAPAPRGCPPARGGGQAEPGLLRGARIGGHGRAGADTRPGPAGRRRSSPTPSVATSAPRPRSRRWRSSTGSARMPSR